MTAIDLAFKMALDEDLDSPRSFAAEVAIKFAKYHVQEALKAASNTKVWINHGDKEELVHRCKIDKDSILNAYSLENIK